jgi:hypothetical protein
MKFNITIFSSLFDNKTHRKMGFECWEDFVEFLRKLSLRELKGKRDAQLISPAIFEDSSLRRNANVLAWAGWAAVDVDDIEISGDVDEYIRNRYGNWDYVVYSTASSTFDKPKFRIVFRLDRHIENSHIKHFWWALNSELDGIGDKQTKDLSRMYYIPATYDDANNFFYVNRGTPINVDELLTKWPYIQTSSGNSFIDKLPEALQEQVLNHRKTKMVNKDKYSWTGIHDCPFVSKKMIFEYKSISETGWYHKLYQFMLSVCFNAIRNGYPITVDEIERLARELDQETGKWYEKRPISVEANSALNYAYKNSEF